MTPVLVTPGIALLALATAGLASAQQSPGTARSAAPARTITSAPGEAPVFVTPQPNGSYVIHRLGEPPSYVTPLPNGGSIIQRPGEPPVMSTGPGLPR